MKRVIILLLLVVALGIAYLRYEAAGERALAAGKQTHQNGECAVAVKHYRHVSSVYWLALRLDLDSAESGAAECDIVLSADNARNEENFEFADSQYRSYEVKYPTGVLRPLVRSRIAATYRDWAMRLAKQGRYIEAIKKYQTILKSYRDTNVASRAGKAIPDTYRIAIRPFTRKDYCASIGVLSSFAKASSLTAAQSKAVVKKARASLPRALYACGVSRYKKGDHDKAVDAFTRLIKEHPGSSLVARAQSVRSSALFRRGILDYRRGNYDGAVDALTRLIRQNPSSSLVPQAQASLARAREARTARRIADRIADIRREGAGKLPAPSAVGGTSSGTVTVVVTNDSPDALEILISGPRSRVVALRRCRGCSIYSSFALAVVRPCDRSGLPSTTFTLPAGRYDVAVVSADPRVRSFYGSWRLRSGTRYASCFYVVRGP